MVIGQPTKPKVPTKPTSNPFLHTPGGSPNPNGYVPPQPAYNPFANIGHEGSGFATRNDPVTPVETPVTPVTPVTPALSFDAQALADPEYKTRMADREVDNTLTSKALRDAWLQHTQGSQDSFNAHGALFSGAKAQADTNIAQGYADDVGRQKLNYDRGGHDIYHSVFNRLVQQMGGVSDGSATQ